MTKNLILTREQVWAKMQSAFSLEEVRTTEKLITAYLKRTGDDSFTSGGEILAHAKDYALTRQQQARELGLSPQETARRESLLRSFRGVEELEELGVIRQACLDWQALHPNDPLLPDCFELLDSKERLANMLLNMESLPQAA
ncbi:hypothetical protein [Armatimonas sp.]|uniref:hypothetical protein n=1 Tax=Armatimonas sp. TaxID=1872638 RepID=UPI003751E36B